MYCFYKQFFVILQTYPDRPHIVNQDTDLSACCPAPAVRPRLLDQVRAAIRRLHYSRRTEEAYIHWIKRYIYFHGKRHPAELGEAEATAFLSHLATDRRVAAATQGQALAALLFLYKQVLGVELGWLDGITRAKRPVRLPTVSTNRCPATRCAILSPPIFCNLVTT